MLHIREIEPYSPYLIDECKIRGYGSRLLVPDSEADVVAAVKQAATSGVPLTVQGMRTGMCGGGVPEGGDVLTTERMDRVTGVGHDKRGYFLRVQPGVTVRQLNEFMRKKGYAVLPSVTPGATEALTSENEPFFYPVDPTELNGSIGGNIATNASGPRTFKYGPTRDWVRRVRVVLSDGSVLDLVRGQLQAAGRRLTVPFADGPREVQLTSYQYNRQVKNTAGMLTEDNMDAVDLFAGSEGIFGIITEADVWLAPAHPLISNIVFFPGDRDAYAFARDFQNCGVMPEFLEFFDSGSLNLIRASRKDDPRFTDMPDLPDYAGSALFFDLLYGPDLPVQYAKLAPLIAAHGGSLDRSWCGYELKDRERFFAFRHSVPQTIFEYVARLKGTSPGIHKMGTDMSVPLDRLDEMMAAYDEVLKRHGLEYVIFGHIGNGHPHVEIVLKNMDDLVEAKKAYTELAERVIALGGSPSAEHGIGKLKTDYIRLMYGEKGVADIRKVKETMDPQWILSPGNMVVR
ncbi:MAG: FAD-binding oxidoreductase [Candidatus Methanomethylophilus sp.]|nr:FAD-binding oxidoreductase [Methanomethylophilus sp.]